MATIMNKPINYSEDTHQFILDNREVLNHVFEYYKETGDYPLLSKVKGHFGKSKRETIERLMSIGLLYENVTERKIKLAFIGFLYCDSLDAVAHLKTMYSIYEVLDGWYESHHKAVDIPFEAFAEDLYPRTWDEKRRYIRNVLGLMAEAPYRIMSLQSIRQNDRDIIKVIRVDEKIYDFDGPDDYFAQCKDQALSEIEPKSETATIRESLSKDSSLASRKHLIDLSHLHPEISSKCNELYKSGNLAEAVEKSFKVVKDKLRELTGYEKGSDAFGRGGLFIRGAAARNVEVDFNEGAKYLIMAIDRFRNEKSHTSDAKIESPHRAYEYLCISSLAMHLLDDSEVRNNEAL